jgi:uncharacterized membrane protein
MGKNKHKQNKILPQKNNFHELNQILPEINKMENSINHPTQEKNKHIVEEVSIFRGSIPIPPGLLKEFKDIFPEAPAIILGMARTEQIESLRLRDEDRKLFEKKMSIESKDMRHGRYFGFLVLFFVLGAIIVCVFKNALVPASILASAVVILVGLFTLGRNALELFSSKSQKKLDKDSNPKK